MEYPAPQEISLETLRDKYCKGDEATADDVQRRVARALAEREDDPGRWQAVFLDAQRRGVVMGGRINSAAGTGLAATWINCFVQPVADSISEPDADGYPGIYVALREATETMRRGGGVGYDMSRLRPYGAAVSTTESDASGPVSYMRVFDTSCQTVESAGARRGAQMGILRVDHPDIGRFVHAKDKSGDLTNFNLSVAVTDAFVEAVVNDEPWELVHSVPPGPRLRSGSEPEQRQDGRYVYETLRARDLWQDIIRSTYDHGEPGVFFVDRANRENNLAYCETIEATNPCAEQLLPAYGCCCLGSINLAGCVRDPFSPTARFDFDQLTELAGIAVRMLDNVLDGTGWPITEQAQEASSKRRVGLGFLALGDALVMLGLRYDSDDGRAFAIRVAQTLRDAAYRASVALARERGPFPLFDAKRYLASRFTSRLPSDIVAAIRAHGIRNSHLLSIAPTGTISLAIADNASNGIEPAFSWTYQRKKREPGGGFRSHVVFDHAYRVYRSLGGDPDMLPDAFVSALEISAGDHLAMVAAVQPYIDSSISKTVNVAADYPFDDFQDLYLDAWRAGVKSLATFRPNEVTGSLLSVDPPGEEVQASDAMAVGPADTDRRIVVDTRASPVLNSLRWPRRPLFPNGNAAHCYQVRHPNGSKFALFIGHIENKHAVPFEVWVNGIEQPRGLNALAINLSYDMYAEDRGWLLQKLSALQQCSADGEGFELPMPPDGHAQYVPSLVAAMARLIHYRCTELGAFEVVGDTPILDALMSASEPRTGSGGTMSWTVDVQNDATGDDFVMGLKELVFRYESSDPVPSREGVPSHEGKLERVQRRPYAVWLSGNYPRALDGLCRSLSLDMRVVDPAWIGKKLIELTNYAEPKGDFFAPVPGGRKQSVYPSTVAYLARLVIHRYSTLGILDEDGAAVEPMGVLQKPDDDARLEPVAATTLTPGRTCDECHAHAVIRVDGCDRCSNCGALGACG